MALEFSDWVSLAALFIALTTASINAANWLADRSSIKVNVHWGYSASALKNCTVQVLNAGRRPTTILSIAFTSAGFERVAIGIEGLVLGVELPAVLPARGAWERSIELGELEVPRGEVPKEGLGSMVIRYGPEGRHVELWISTVCRRNPIKKTFRLPVL
jgi:hypothetical protein